MVITAVPVDAYLRSSFEPDAEYVDGEIEERPVGNMIMPRGQEALLMYFRQHNVKKWKIRGRSPSCGYRLLRAGSEFQM